MSLSLSIASPDIIVSVRPETRIFVRDQGRRYFKPQEYIEYFED